MIKNVTGHTKKIYIWIFCTWGCLSSINSSCQKLFIFSGISKKTESFNIKNIRNSQAAADDNIQYNANKFFSSFNLYAEGRLSISSSVYTSIRTYFRYNHHYYKKLPQPGLVYEQNLPVKRQFKMDVFFDLGKQFFLNKRAIFFIGMGVGVNNINSGYDFTYIDTTYFGQPYDKNFRGNWLKASPSLTIGIAKGKYCFSTDVMFTKDPTFENLPSVNVGFAIFRRIVEIKSRAR